MLFNNLSKTLKKYPLEVAYYVSTIGNGKPLFNFWQFLLFSLIRNHPRKYQKSGFTLTELLLAAMVGVIVTSSILSLTSTIIQDSQTEIARSKTQQQMRIALNYIAEELRGAVYIYTGKGLQTITPYLPSFGSSKTPVLAFWKVESVPYISTGSLPANCSTLSTQTLIDECNNLKTERNSYTLVVYLRSTENTSNSWKGQSRLERYQLRKYSNTSTLTQNKGYVDPRQQSSFGEWPLLDGSNQQVNAASMSNATEPLVDFVYVHNPANPIPANLPDCVTNSTDNTYSSPVYTSNSAYSRGFFACVSFVDNDNDLVPDTYQDVKLFLTGNAKGQTGYQTADSLILLESQVMTKGVIQKKSVD